MSEELAVAAVAVFAVTQVRRRGGAGAALRPTVLVLYVVSLTRGLLAQRRTVHQLVPFTCLVPKPGRTHIPVIIKFKLGKTSGTIRI